MVHDCSISKRYVCNKLKLTFLVWNELQTESEAVSFRFTSPATGNLSTRFAPVDRLQMFPVRWWNKSAGAAALKMLSLPLTEEGLCRVPLTDWTGERETHTHTHRNTCQRGCPVVRAKESKRNGQNKVGANMRLPAAGNRPPNAACVIWMRSSRSSRDSPFLVPLFAVF